MSENILRRAEENFVSMPYGARVATAMVILVLAGATTWLVLFTGGIRYAFSHLMYVPIVLGGLVFGATGGVAAAVVGGLLLGPTMPIDTSTGEMQLTINWVYRLLFFCMVGAVVGAGAQLLRKHLARLQWLHEHHPDTGLLNLPGLLKQLDALIHNARPGQQLSISVTQFNNLLEIQNTFGIEFGDKLLAQIIERSRNVVAPGAILALIQPDRLATVIQGEEEAREARDRVHTALDESFIIDGVPIHVEASLGVARFPMHGGQADNLLQKAGIAMYWANTGKVLIADYDGSKDLASRDNLMLLGALPDAIVNGELRIWHQAKLDLATGEISGTEALLRWQHPKRGLVPPGHFIPQLEETTLINPVTNWVIDAAFADMKQWRANGYDLRIAVNLSVRNLQDRKLLDVLIENATRHGLNSAEIELEITESAIMADVDYCIRLIALLRRQGYRVSIDDFGAGHSSLGYLRKFHASSIKIDRQFITTLADDDDNQHIVRCILSLAKSMDIETVAEGVEDERALALLRDWGCNYAQGYYVHRPAPSDSLLDFLDARSNRDRGTVNVDS